MLKCTQLRCFWGVWAFRRLKIALKVNFMAYVAKL